MHPPDSKPGSEMAAAALRHLEALGASTKGVKLAVLTTEDGFEIAAWRGSKIAGRIAAMSSSLQALSEAITREAGLAGSRGLIIEAETGTILVLGIASTSPRISLAVVATEGETLGQLLWAARHCCKSLEQALEA
jgi:predicted regulator of Ras-like GTPase activity (Roadblock/LC7/MglB family)